MHVAHIIWVSLDTPNLPDTSPKLTFYSRQIYLVPTLNLPLRQPKTYLISSLNRPYINRSPGFWFWMTDGLGGGTTPGSRSCFCDKIIPYRDGFCVEQPCRDTYRAWSNFFPKPLNGVLVGVSTVGGAPVPKFLNSSRAKDTTSLGAGLTSSHSVDGRGGSLGL